MDPYGLDDVAKAIGPVSGRNARMLNLGMRRVPVSRVAGRNRRARTVRVVLKPATGAPKAGSGQRIVAGQFVQNALIGTGVRHIVRGVGAGAKYAGSAAIGAIGGAKAAQETDERKEHKKVAKALGAPTPPPTDESIRRRKKVQGALGMTAAGLGSAAFATKTGGMLLPKVLKTPAKAAKYKTHLDRAATVALFGASGVGGASGLHQSRIYQLEGRKKVAKAFDPEKRRLKRAEVYERGLSATSGALGVGALSHAVGRAVQQNRRVGFQIQAGQMGAKAREMDQRAAKAQKAKHAYRPFREAANVAHKGAQAMEAKATATKVPRARTTLALAGGAVAADLASRHIRRQRKGSWQPATRRYVSKAMPDQADVHVNGARGKKKPRRVLRPVTITYC